MMIPVRMNGFVVGNMPEPDNHLCARFEYPLDMGPTSVNDPVVVHAEARYISGQLIRVPERKTLWVCERDADLKVTAFFALHPYGLMRLRGFEPMPNWREKLESSDDPSRKVLSELAMPAMIPRKTAKKRSGASVG